MKGQIQYILNGSQNAKLRSKKETQSRKNTAEANVKNIIGSADIPVIDEEAARNAKEWADNGSRL